MIQISRQQAMEYLDEGFFVEPTGERFRWSVGYRMVFKHSDGKYYEALFQQGTGDEAEQPWQDQRVVDCYEVTQQTKTVMFWARVPE
jgi:hypothetical protein